MTKEVPPCSKQRREAERRSCPLLSRNTAVGAPPLLGQHTRQVLEEAGFSREEVQDLFKAELAKETVP